MGNWRQVSKDIRGLFGHRMGGSREFRQAATGSAVRFGDVENTGQEWSAEAEPITGPNTTTVMNWWLLPSPGLGPPPRRSRSGAESGETAQCRLGEKGTVGVERDH